MLILRIVTRGTNQEAVSRTVQACEKMQYAFPIGKRFIIQVVSDTKLKIKYNGFDAPELIVVPKYFKPKNGAKWKARALEWAKDKQDKGDWVLHLDEESIPTRECIQGCYDFMDRHECAVGQGEILYSGNGYNPWKATCASDALRTGDDVLRFKFQYKTLHAPIFGSHGSFLLVPDVVERTIGWDVGANGSVTEDAAFALTCWSRGIPFDWVEGTMIEQSPYNFLDFVKQRRRWFNGLWIVATCPDFKLRYRIVLWFFMLYWTLSPYVILLCINFWILQLPMPFVLSVFLKASLVYYVLSYAIGGWRNGRYMGLLASLVSIPRSFFYEACGVIYGIFRPVKTFEVIEKN